MSRNFRNHFQSPNHKSMHFIIDPGGPHNASQFELEREYKPKHDPNDRPPPERGDIWVALGAVIGLVTGAIIGALLGMMLNWAYLTIFFGGLGGAVLGSLAGAIIGDRIKKIAIKRRELPGKNAGEKINPGV